MDRDEEQEELSMDANGLAHVPQLAAVVRALPLPFLSFSFVFLRLLPRRRLLSLRLLRRVFLGLLP